MGMQVNLVEASKFYHDLAPIPISFTNDEAKRLQQSHFDALVIDLEIERHLVMRNLID